MAWRLAVGNLVSRAPAVPAVGGGGSMLVEYPMTDIANGHPDDPVRWTWSAGGVYSASFDLNLLAQTSDKTDAPSGWRDLALTLMGTPGIGANPPEWGTFAARATSLKFYGPVFQDVEIMPGETVTFTAGIYRPAASDATGVRVVVIDLGTGLHWDAADSEWNSGADGVGAQATDDAWLDLDVDITNAGTERTTYRVVLSPDGGAGATFYAYASDPSLVGEQDFVSLVGHNVPEGATATWSDGTPITITVTAPTMWKTFTASSSRTWDLTITVPASIRPFTPAPFIGELWAGRLVDMVACPGYPFDIIEGDIGQVRLEGGLGREDVFTEIERPLRAFKLRFKTTNASQYEDARDSFLRASRFGAEPIMLAPVDALEGAGTIWHGRVGPETTYARIGTSKRTFEITMRESPYPRFR